LAWQLEQLFDDLWRLGKLGKMLKTRGFIIRNKRALVSTIRYPLLS